VEESVTDSDISIKGMSEGLLITVGNGDWEALADELTEQISAQGDFFRGARVALQVGQRDLRHAALRELREKLAEREIHLFAILWTSPSTQRAARRLQLETGLQDSTTREIELPPLESDVFGSDGVLAHQTLRSGRQVRHTGHVAVIGDVNPGAEIIAGGDIVVWGRLRGTVHAGARGDESAVVCALVLAPIQLRIADHIAVSPEGNRRSPRPEMASVREGQIVAEEWVP
jgi:septum site-determining protein MinC